jgi:prepilin signal peptidase PulO-like enzyme (type II secretory pathway)
VEALTALLFVLAALEFHDRPYVAAQICVLLACLVAVTFIDLDHRIIPDAITKPGMILALLLSVVPPFQLHPPDWIRGVAPGMNSLLHATAGCLTGLLTVYGVRWLGTLAFGREAMGQGDAKLLGLIGAFLGPLGALYSLMMACVGGVVVHGLLVLVAGRGPKPLELEVEAAGGTTQTFRRARVTPVGRIRRKQPLPTAYLLEVVGDQPLPVGEAVKVRAVLPKVRVLADEDVSVTGKATVEAAQPAGAGSRVRLRWEGLSPVDAEHFSFFALSHKYLPFGPYLALGGAATAIYLAAIQDLLRWWAQLYVIAPK